MTTTLVAAKNKLFVPPASSSYPDLGVSYNHGGYTIGYSNGLTLSTNNRYWDASFFELRSEVPQGGRMSAAAEELAIILKYEMAANVLGRAMRRGCTFKPGDLAAIKSFARNEMEKEAVSFVYASEGIGTEEDKDYILQYIPREGLTLARSFYEVLGKRKEKDADVWKSRELLTDTFLRVPEGMDPCRWELDSKGRGRYIREFGVGDKIIGIVAVPKQGIVPETKDLLEVWDPITGLPRVTVDPKDVKYNQRCIHFAVDPVPKLRNRETGKLDDIVIALMNGQGRTLDGSHTYCLHVDGKMRPDKTHFKVPAYRLVEGPLPEIQKVSLQDKVN